MGKDKTPGDYEVGYGKPPKKHRFKKGQSGNRAGRPRGKKSYVMYLREEYEAEVEVKENGETKKIPNLQALAKQTANESFKNIRVREKALDRLEQDDLSRE